MKRIWVLGISALIMFSCDQAKELFKFHSAPEIETIQFFPVEAFPGDTVTASITAKDPEGASLSYQWEISPARGVVLGTTDQPVLKWLAPLEGGLYRFEVTVSNQYKEAKTSRQYRVLDLQKPLVQIHRPENGEYFTQLQSIEVEAEAYHSNGILKVELWVNDSLITIMPRVAGDLYAASFVPDTTFLGTTILKVMAEAALTHTINSDSVRISVEGILPGKVAVR